MQHQICYASKLLSGTQPFHPFFCFLKKPELKLGEENNTKSMDEQIKSSPNFAGLHLCFIFYTSIKKMRKDQFTGGITESTSNNMWDTSNFHCGQLLAMEMNK